MFRCDWSAAFVNFGGFFSEQSEERGLCHCFKISSGVRNDRRTQKVASGGFVTLFCPGDSLSKSWCGLEIAEQVGGLVLALLIILVVRVKFESCRSAARWILNQARFVDDSVVRDVIYRFGCRRDSHGIWSSFIVKDGLVGSLFGDPFGLDLLLLFALKGRLLERMSIKLARLDTSIAEAVRRSFFDSLVLARPDDFLTNCKLHWCVFYAILFELKLIN